MVDRYMGSVGFLITHSAGVCFRGVEMIGLVLCLDSSLSPSRAAISRTPNPSPPSSSPTTSSPVQFHRAKPDKIKQDKRREGRPQ